LFSQNIDFAHKSTSFPDLTGFLFIFGYKKTATKAAFFGILYKLLFIDYNLLRVIASGY